MALFSKKTEEKKDAAAKAPVAKAQTATQQGGASLSHILKHARITEKASMHQGAGVYTFDIAENATKRDIIAAIRALYKVTPLKVAVVTVRSKTRRSMRTGRVGVKKGGRKAYVYLKKGETITIS
jgi:large subunit ribosomal protein L23